MPHTETMEEDVKSDKKMITEGVHKHERNMHPGKKPTKLFAKGGVTNEQRKSMGRNVSRLHNQFGGKAMIKKAGRGR